MSHIEKILAYATRQGADNADAIYVNGVDLSVACRKQQPEELERSESSGVGLRVWVGDRLACVSTSDLSDDSLSAMAERAVAMANVATADPFSLQAREDQLCTDIRDLELADSTEPDAASMLDMAMQAEQAALEIDGITNSEGADCSYGKSIVKLAMTNGFTGEYEDTSFSASVSVIAGEGEHMERDYDYCLARFLSDLPEITTIGVSAANKALKRLNPRKKASSQVPVIYDPRVARSLLGSFAGAINGAAIARGTSFLKDHMHEQVFGEHITITDDPYRVRGLGSHPFDAEGLGGMQRNLIENGVLTSWLMDLRSAAKLGLESTGHASRGLGSHPSPSSTNLYMQAGNVTPEALISDVADGFYVTETFGMGVNLITGDYSQGASGFWIEQGEICYPVAELTIAGHLGDMFKQITPANDLEFRYGTNTPTLRVDGMTIAGASE